MALDVGVQVHSYYTDSGIYCSDGFLKELQAKGQGIKISGVSAQFQNGAAESIIQSALQYFRTMMLHASLRWPEAADESLWPHALQWYAVYLHDIMPHEDSVMSPIKVWSRTKSNHHDLLHTHSWGCPAYHLRPKLRAGGNVPKWEPRSKRGQFAGYCPKHASNVGMIRKMSTHHFSPQFHVMNNAFFKMCSLEASPHPQEIGMAVHLQFVSSWLGHWTPRLGKWMAFTRITAFEKMTTSDQQYWLPPTLC